MNTRKPYRHIAAPLLLFVFSLAMYPLCAQNNYARVAGGFNYTIPELKKGYSSDPWKGINIRSKFLELGYVAGRVNTPTEQKTLAYNFYMGANIPIRRLGFGRRPYGIKGILVAPFIAADIGWMGINKSHSWQFTAAPGVSIQLPYVLVDFRLNTMLAFKGITGFHSGRYMFAPTVTLQFDGLWDVMDPKLRFDAHYEGTYVWTDVTEYADYDEYTTHYEPYSYDVYRYNVGPHISIGPRIAYWNLKNGNNKTFMAGIVQSGRAGNFGYDLIAEKGSITTENDQELKAIRGTARLSINLNASKSTNTLFTRLMIGAGLGYNWFTQSSPYAHSENGEFFNLFASIEFGAVAFSYEVNKAFYNRFDDQKFFAFTYRVPIERVVYRYRELKESKNH